MEKSDFVLKCTTFVYSEDGTCRKVMDKDVVKRSYTVEAALAICEMNIKKYLESKRLADYLLVIEEVT